MELISSDDVTYRLNYYYFYKIYTCSAVGWLPTFCVTTDDMTNLLITDTARKCVSSLFMFAFEFYCWGDVKYEKGQRITLIEHMFRWAVVCALTFVEYYLANSFIANSLTHIFLPKWFPVVISSGLELAFLLLAILNTFTYAVLYVCDVFNRSTKAIKKVSKGSKASSAKLDVSVSAEEKSRCIASICSYLDNFFKSSIVGTPASGRLNTSSSFNSSGRSEGGKDTSLSSLVGYHDSPSNRSITSIHTRQQLQELISRDNSVIDSFSNGSLFINAKRDDDRPYQAGTPFSLTNSEQAVTQAKCLFTSLETSPKGSNKFSDDFRRSFSEYQSKYSSSGGGGFIARQETDLNKILKKYSINYADMEEYELKLKIWMRNTIIHPLSEKIEEMNELLASKFAGAHLKIGASSVDTFMAAFATKPELRNTLIPFILPYLRIHSNQNYLVQRIAMLSKNIALKHFYWNGGGVEVVHDEASRISKVIDWNDSLPTDSELVYFCFCTYMDFLLSTHSISSPGHSNIPFSNSYFLYGKGDSKQMILDSQPDAFFVRMASTHPPILEFVINGGDDILVPNKDSGNLFVVLILFIAHVNFFYEKFTILNPTYKGTFRTMISLTNILAMPSCRA